MGKHKKVLWIFNVACKKHVKPKNNSLESSLCKSNRLWFGVEIKRIAARQMWGHKATLNSKRLATKLSTPSHKKNKKREQKNQINQFFIDKVKCVWYMKSHGNILCRNVIFRRKRQMYCAFTRDSLCYRNTRNTEN